MKKPGWRTMTPLFVSRVHPVLAWPSWAILAAAFLIGQAIGNTAQDIYVDAKELRWLKNAR